MNIQLITEAMQAQHLSPEQLAATCAVSRPTIERILNGTTTNPGILVVTDICVALGISIDDLMGMPPRAQTAPAAAPSTHSAELSSLYRSMIYTKDAWIRRLAIACAVLVACNMLYWMLDIANPSAGWITTQSSTASNICRVLIVAALSVGVVAALVISARNSKARRP